MLTENMEPKDKQELDELLASEPQRRRRRSREIAQIPGAQVVNINRG